jgi:hypothetical protein
MEDKMELILAHLDGEIRNEHRKYHDKVEQLINKVNNLEAGEQSNKERASNSERVK